MTDVAANEEPIQPDRLILNLDAVLEKLDVGVRRAAAFVTVGSQPSTGEFPVAAMLGNRGHFQIFPTQPTDADVENLRSEYTAWITGNALKELDTYVHLFLDALWEALQLGMQGPVIPAGFIFEPIEQVTNSATKWKRVCEALGDINPDISHYRNLANARNVLTHQAGQVTAAKAFHDGRLKVSWLSMQTRFVGEDGTTYEMDPETGRVMADVATRLVVTWGEEERFFNIGERVRLTTEEVGQICMFIQLTGRGLFDRMVGRLREAGLIPVEASL